MSFYDGVFLGYVIANTRNNIKALAGGAIEPASENHQLSMMLFSSSRK